jgi:F0F1-type ATP synthase assembly protein I
MEKKPKPDSDEPFRRYERPVLPHERKADPGFRGAGMAAAGIEFAMVVGIFVFGGRWIDGHFGTEPWATLGLTLLGVAAAMTMLIRQAMRLTAKRPEATPPSEVDEKKH